MVTGAPVELFSVKKNNLGSQEGLAVREGKGTASPTIYLEPYYQRYREGCPPGELIREMLAFYESRKEDVPLTTKLLRDFGKLRGRVVYRLLGREKNEELLEEYPHQRFLDMAVICSLLFEWREPGRAAAMPVEKEHLRMWGVTEEELFRAARENTPKLLPLKLQEFGEFMGDFLQGELEECIGKRIAEGETWTQGQIAGAKEALRQRMEKSKRESPVYILGNSLNLYGSSSLLYEGAAAWCRGQIGEDYYVIPSSIHEVLLLPESSCPEPGKVRQMVREISRDHVRPEEVLSGSLYRYREKMGILEKWEAEEEKN